MFATVMITPSVPVSFGLRVILFPTPPTPAAGVLILTPLVVSVESSSVSRRDFSNTFSSVLYSSSLVTSSVGFAGWPRVLYFGVVIECFCFCWCLGTAALCSCRGLYRGLGGV